MLKVVKEKKQKRKKEREKAHTQPRKQNTRYVRSLNVRINHATHRLKKKHFLRAVTNANKAKKSDFNRANIFCRKKLTPKGA